MAPDKGIFDGTIEELTTSLVQKLQDALPAMLAKLDGSSFQVTVPGLAQPITVTYRKP